MTNISERQHEQNILELYKNLGSAKCVANELEISILDVYVVLKKHKLSIEERMQMAASATSILGAQGEDEFKKLVPFAVEVNAVINANPAFDFLVGDITIDVKASHIVKRGVAKVRREQWFFVLQRSYQSQYGAQFYVLFALYGKDPKDGYDTYIIPSELLAGIKSVNINIKDKENSQWRDFLIQNDKVCEFFEKMKASTEHKPQIFDASFLEKKADFYQVEVSELQSLSRKVKRELSHAE
ncbi:MAG: hypothetical protein RSA22_07290 [Acinetobacter sp.]